ncbi:DUF4165 domain-containing protein (plasmid) [Vibrio harveyi]|nr:DUF4165 domain-containing protein [Vibrio harveyi]
MLEYSFNTPDGAERTLSPSTVYANPTGNIKFALSAGIDRKVKISIVKATRRFSGEFGYESPAWRRRPYYS